MAAAAGSAGVAGVAVGSVGVAVLPEVPVGVGGAVAPVAAAGDGVALAALALAGALGSSLLGAGVELGVEADPPLIAAANAVMWVRTSWSLVRADSSSVIDSSGLAPVVVLGAVAVEPVVPAGAGVAAPVVPVLPSSSVRMRSAAATSVVQLALRARWPHPTPVSVTPPVRGHSSAASARRLVSSPCQSVTPRGCRPVPTAPDADARSQTPAACPRRACDLSVAQVRRWSADAA